MPGRNIPLSVAGPAFELICDCWICENPQVYTIFGALQPINVENDVRLQALVPHAKSYPMPNDDKHSPMITLTARRKFRMVMDLLARA